MVGDLFADAALHFEFGRRTVDNGDAQADSQIAVFIGGVLGFVPMSGEQFADVFKVLVLEGLFGVSKVIFEFLNDAADHVEIARASLFRSRAARMSQPLAFICISVS